MPMSDARALDALRKVHPPRRRMTENVYCVDPPQRKCIAFVARSLARSQNRLALRQA